jgi:hypothetical protein
MNVKLIVHGVNTAGSHYLFMFAKSLQRLMTNGRGRGHFAPQQAAPFWTIPWISIV